MRNPVGNLEIIAACQGFAGEPDKGKLINLIRIVPGRFTIMPPGPAAVTAEQFALIRRDLPHKQSTIGLTMKDHKDTGAHPVEQITVL